MLLCGPADAGRRPSGRGAPGCQAPSVLPGLPCVAPCQPGALLSLNVSDAGQMVSVTPALRRPDVDGTRVEVNGQVGGGAAGGQARLTGGLAPPSLGRPASAGASAALVAVLSGPQLSGLACDAAC